MLRPGVTPLAIFLLGVLLALPAGCGGGGAGDDDVPPPPGDGGTPPPGDGGTPPRDTGPIDPPPPPMRECEEPVSLADVSSPTTVVGDGSAASCTAAAVQSALDAGGVVTFDCGGEHTITLTESLRVTADVVIDGGGEITLSGGDTARILDMDTGNFEATGPLLTVQRLTFRDARASGELTDGGGGAIFYRGGSVTAIDCQFLENTASELGPDVAGGAIYGIGVGETIVVGSTFAGNRASNGGAIGALHTQITVVNSTFESNTATGWGANYVEGGVQMGQGGNGGAISMDGNGRSLSICGSTFRDNEAGALGGAVFRTGYETEPNEIHRSTFDSNTVREDERDPERGSSAGALYLQGVHVVMTNTTISNNSSAGGAGMRVLAHGPDAPGIVEMTNVTMSGNFTYEREDFTTRGVGAGLIVGQETTGTLLNCTIAGNAAQFGSGIWNASPLTIRNTIIANEAENVWTPLNCSGSSYAMPPASGENNIQWPNGMSDDDMDCTPGILRADPMLMPLADNGGPTWTRMPMAGSPVIGAGTGCPDTDQRGEPRGEPCALGAVEP